MAIVALIAELQTIPDWRGARAVQYPLWLILLMGLLATLSGYSTLRGWDDFMRRHQAEAAELFDLTRTALPKYNTLRRMTRYVPPEQVADCFHRWAQATLPVPEGEAIAVDGKALANTITDCRGQRQNFVTIVSACVQSYAGVIGQTSFHNGERSEIHSVRELLALLDVDGTWFTLDALHCQKKRSPPSSRAEVTTASA